MKALLLGVALMAVGCGKKKQDTQTGQPQPGQGMPTAHLGTNDKPGAAAPPGQDQSGGASNTAPTASDCPKELRGSETVNRLLPKGCTTTVIDDYHVNGAQLTIEPGVTVRFRDGATLNVGYSDSAKLIVKGTPDAPVTFTPAGDKVPGVWGGVRLYQHADRSSLDHLVMEFAGKDGAEALKVDADDVVITGSTLRGAKGVGIGIGQHGSLAKFSGNTFEDIAKFPVSLGATAVGGLEEGNRFPPGSLIQIYGGTITGSVRWGHVGIPYYVSEDIHVEGDGGARGTLEITSGVEVRMGSSARVIVGYSTSASLKVTGKPDAPVRFTAYEADKKPGAWGSVRIYANGEGTIDNAVFEYGGAGDQGALQFDGEGAGTVTGTSFTNNTWGASFGDRSKLKLFDKNVFEGNEKAAVFLYPVQFAALGAGNKYGVKERIQLKGGRVDGTVTWHAQGAPVEVIEDVSVDGRAVLTIEAGSTFLQKDGTSWGVGYSDNATLKLLGTADKPIRFAGLRDEPGSWYGIWLGANSRDSVIDNVVVRDAGQQDSPGVKIEGSASAKVTRLACEKCAGPAISWQCQSKVMLADVRATEGTKKAEAKPTCN
jgi:hypothetical protein